jgi:WD40 repeat protein
MLAIRGREFVDVVTYPGLKNLYCFYSTVDYDYELCPANDGSLIMSYDTKFRVLNPGGDVEMAIEYDEENDDFLINGVAFRPDGSVVVVHSDDTSARIIVYDLKTDHHVLSSLDLEQPSLFVNAVFTADTSAVAVEMINGKINIYDVTTGTLEHQLDHIQNEGHKSYKPIMKMVFTKTGHRLLVCIDSTYLVSTDLLTEQSIELRGVMDICGLSSDDSLVLVRRTDSEIEFLDTTTLETVESLPGTHRLVVLTPQDEVMTLIEDDDGDVVRVMDMVSGDVVQEIRVADLLEVEDNVLGFVFSTPQSVILM